MKILTAEQLKALDAFTVEEEDISFLDLMERASTAVAEKIMQKWDVSTCVKVFAGPGNNGGDALAVSRILALAGYKVYVYFFNTRESGPSPDCQENMIRIKACDGVSFTEVKSSFNPPVLHKTDLVVDGLFGTGLNKVLSGGFALVVKYINASDATVVSIDMPSGLMCENNYFNVPDRIIKADYTYTFQYPKLAFFFPENEEFLGNWEVLDIGLKDPGTEMSSTNIFLTETSEMALMLKDRSRFAHKGSVGNAALVAGKKGMAGAAILCSKACMRAGVGKLTVRTPEYNVLPLQISVPEAVLSVDPDSTAFSQTFDMTPYKALGMGPGMGTEQETSQAFIEQLSLTNVPVVLDADAINILGNHRGWVAQLPYLCILTPHKKELAELIGSTSTSYEQLEKTRNLCVQKQLVIVIKGAFSAVCCPDGSVFFNPTGNPGMATAGSGDVLTGIILALLAQGYPPTDAARLGVYLHGLAGDMAADELGYESLVASDLVDYLPKAFKRLRK